jgi:hypothetical protein
MNQSFEELMEQLNNPVTLIVVSSLIFLVVAVLSVGLPRLVSHRWNKHKAQTVHKWEAAGIKFQRGPNGGKFGGLESMGVSRVITGVGYVALTAKDLRVTRVTPFGEWIITFKQIKSVTMRSAFMGQRSQKTPFIVVRFIKDGQADKLGFQVGDTETWAEDLARAAKVSLKNELDEADD